MKHKEKKYLISLLTFSLCIFTIYAIIVPFNSAPDEKLRFDIVDFIVKNKALPIGGDPRLYYGEYGVTYVFKPYLAYIISAILCTITDIFKINIEHYMVARLFSVICGVGTIYFTYLISSKIFDKSRFKYIIPFFLATIPQFAFINCYVNQDSLMIFLSSIMIYLWILGIERKWSYDIVIKVGIISGLMLLTYLNGYIIIFATLIIVLLTYENKDVNFIKKTTLCISIMILISGWFFIRNLIIYNGEIFGSSIARELRETLAIPSLKPSNIDVPYKSGINMISILYKTDWLKKTFMSFWAMLGNMDVRVGYYYYVIMIIFTVVSVLGVMKLISLKIKDRVVNKREKIYITFAITIILSIIGSLRYSTYNDYQPQGRYLYSAIISILLVMFEGIENIILRGKIINTLILFLINIIIIMNLTLPILAMLNKFYFLI